MSVAVSELYAGSEGKISQNKTLGCRHIV